MKVLLNINSFHLNGHTRMVSSTDLNVDWLWDERAVVSKNGASLKSFIEKQVYAFFITRFKMQSVRTVTEKLWLGNNIFVRKEVQL